MTQSHLAAKLTVPYGFFFFTGFFQFGQFLPSPNADNTSMITTLAVVGDSLNVVHWERHLVDIRRCCLRVVVHLVTPVAVLVNMVLFVEMTLPLYFILPDSS